MSLFSSFTNIFNPIRINKKIKEINDVEKFFSKSRIYPYGVCVIEMEDIYGNSYLMDNKYSIIEHLNIVDKKHLFPRININDIDYYNKLFVSKNVSDNFLQYVGIRQELLKYQEQPNEIINLFRVKTKEEKELEKYEKKLRIKYRVKEEFERE